MLASQRQRLIMVEVHRQGGVRVSDLVTQLDVSDMTIRRDLEALSRRGLVEKVHGGATLPVMRAADEPGFAAKSSREPGEKEAIAKAAAALIPPGTSIAISAGTTTWALARHLSGIAGLTVVTNSVPVADVLHRSGSPDRTVILTGGVRTPSNALVGSVAISALLSLHVDMVFMGVHGMDEHAGLTTPNLLEAETNQAMIRSGRRLVVVADHTKWGNVGLSRFARIQEAHVVISDDRLPDSARDTLDSMTQLMIVESGD
ncbi:DeoR/GlpR family DNA-binding transcription regulator [Acidothermaceae bacterium B102]|nr:DeoR/GlpR family DNA-binding transcription regulator [Acidothermaceae bacterium B102]